MPTSSFPSFPELHLRIREATVHESHGKRWIGLPAKPQITSNGQVRRDEVLDVDGAEGEATLRKLEASRGLLPPTVEAISGNGRHVYFRWPTGTDIRNGQCREDLPGLDWRGQGGYVLAPPSIHPSGRAYAWSVDSAGEFAEAPSWLLELVTARVYRAGEGADSARWRSFVNEDVDGSRRGHAIARLYGLLVRRYIDPVVALDLCRQFNALRCKSPLDDAEVVRVCSDIASREADRREGARHDG